MATVVSVINQRHFDGVRKVKNRNEMAFVGFGIHVYTAVFRYLGESIACGARSRNFF